MLYCLKAIANHVQFKLLKKEWKEFCDALAAPPKAIPALRRLFTKPGLFDATAENSTRFGNYGGKSFFWLCPESALLGVSVSLWFNDA